MLIPFGPSCFNKRALFVRTKMARRLQACYFLEHSPFYFYINPIIISYVVEL